jgi:hypothetical protein
VRATFYQAIGTGQTGAGLSPRASQRQGTLEGGQIETEPREAGPDPRLPASPRPATPLESIYALLASSELRGVQIGGRRVWRVSEADLADYLKRAYAGDQGPYRGAGQRADEEPAED